MYRGRRCRHKAAYPDLLKTMRVLYHITYVPFYHAATLALVRAGSAEGLWRCSLMRAFSRRAAAARGVLGDAVIPGLRGKDPRAPAEAP